MLSSMLKEHQVRQNARKEEQGIFIYYLAVDLKSMLTVPVPLYNIPRIVQKLNEKKQWPPLTSLLKLLLII